MGFVLRIFSNREIFSIALKTTGKMGSRRVANGLTATCVSLTAAFGLGWLAHTQLSDPVYADPGKKYIHGTQSWSELPEKGSVIDVRNHLFVADGECPNAMSFVKDYAMGVATSAHRPSSNRLSLSSGYRPAVLVLKPAEGDPGKMKKGFFGGHPYFCDGTKLQVVDVIVFEDREVKEFKEEHKAFLIDDEVY